MSRKKVKNDVMRKLGEDFIKATGLSIEELMPTTEELIKQCKETGIEVSEIFFASPTQSLQVLNLSKSKCYVKFYNGGHALVLII